MMIFITLEQLLQLHVLVLAKDGGVSGVRDAGRLEAAVATQEQQVFGSDIYAGAFQKVAALMRNIIADHAFIDGNKRTAMLAGLTLLELNGYVVNLKKGELEDFAVSVATNHLDISAIADWLQKHSTS